jgi:hypothetical protein
MTSNFRPARSVLVALALLAPIPSFAARHDVSPVRYAPGDFTTPTDARTVTVDAKLGDLIRVRAFGPGGVSEAAVTSVGSMPRRRADRH